VSVRYLALAAVAGVAAWVLTGWVRAFALRTSMLDVPNPRSSHTTPTPRGGGLAIAVVTLGGIALAAAAGWVPPRTAAALAGGGVLVAAVGWMDDRRGVPRATRLAVQITAAAWAVWCLGGMPSLRFGLGSGSLGPAGALLAVAGITWSTNCFNFMDGIDGLAGGEAAITGLAVAALTAGGHPEIAVIALLVGAASTGFLVWNWSPAKVFMGDVGSGLLGFLFGAGALASERAGALPIVGWSLLLGVFLFDATATLVRRMWTGERWYEPHRSHAYQRAVQLGWSHARVASAVLLIDLALAAAVWAAGRRPDWQLALALAALAGLGGLYAVVQRAWTRRMAESRAPAGVS
jgi:Fuc2NAc and GlcNAc transferase